MNSAQKLRKLIAGQIDKGRTAEDNAEDIVRMLRFGEFQFHVVDHHVHEVIETDYIGGSTDGELGWNVYTTEE